MPPRRILIVDDEKEVLEAWARALRLARHSVWVASKADQALSLCDENSFDLVILDYIMPSMDGIELLRRIRKRLPLIRSILISGKIDKETGEADVRNIVKESIEVDIYLHKPLSNENFLSSVEEVFSHNEQEPSWAEIAQESTQARHLTRRKVKATSKKLKALVKKRR
jgi:CheY-like chemotaxis protein